MKKTFTKWITICSFNIGVNIIGLPIFWRHNVQVFNYKNYNKPKSNFF